MELPKIYLKLTDADAFCKIAIFVSSEIAEAIIGLLYVQLTTRCESPIRDADQNNVQERQFIEIL